MRRLLPAAALGALLLVAAPAHAATFQVNTAADDTTCNTITCSVRGALTAAQANGAAEDDVINVPAGTFAVATELGASGANGARITVVGAGANATVSNPCLARGTAKAVDIEDARVPGGQFGVTMVGADVGAFDACNRVVELVMAKDAICEVKPCSFNGVYQPSLMDTFPAGKVLLLSYFYDRLQPFLDASPELAKGSPSVATFAALAQQVCLGKPSWTQHWGANAALMEELEGRPEWCLDLTFMHALLRLGYELDGAREVQVGKKIEGTELGWCLGATLALVGADIKCRI